MPVNYAITKRDDGFTLKLHTDTTGIQTVEITPYELSRNNIKARDIKAVKHYAETTGAATKLTTDSDLTIFPPMRGGVQPINIGSGTLTIELYMTSPPYGAFGLPVEHQFFFYNTPQGCFLSNLYVAAP